MFGITHPHSRGHLRLASTDPRTAVEIDPAYLSDERDVALFLEAMVWARRFGHSRAYSGWRGAEILPDASDLASRQARIAFVQSAVMTHHHPVGTCRMAAGERAVTAPDLRLQGCNNLFVVDGSILPSLTTGPVNAAIIAVAEKAAGMISAGLG